MNFHQDWTPVVFKKKIVEKKPHVEQSPFKKLDENKESFEHKKIPKYISDAVRKTRTDKKITQDQLAKMINEKSCVVNDIENGRGVYENVKINKVLKALGLTLKNARSLSTGI